MGNCQAIDTATLVVQHPCGKSDKYYFPVSASEIMKMNPGHYVALLISTTLCNSTNPPPPHQQIDTTNTNNNVTTSVRVTRIKLLRPTDTLVLGQVYRLITNQDVMKGLMAKKQAKNRTGATGTATESSNQSHRLVLEKPTRSHFDKDNNQVMKKHERQRTSRTTTVSSTNSSASSSVAVAASAAAMSKSRIWQPSLQSISEAQT